MLVDQALGVRPWRGLVVDDGQPGAVVDQPVEHAVPRAAVSGLPLHRNLVPGALEPCRVEQHRQRRRSQQRIGLGLPAGHQRRVDVLAEHGGQFRGQRGRCGSATVGRLLQQPVDRPAASHGIRIAGFAALRRRPDRRRCRPQRAAQTRIDRRLRRFLRGCCGRRKDAEPVRRDAVRCAGQRFRAWRQGLCGAQAALVPARFRAGLAAFERRHEQVLPSAGHRDIQQVQRFARFTLAARFDQCFAERIARVGIAGEQEMARRRGIGRPFDLPAAVPVVGGRRAVDQEHGGRFQPFRGVDGQHPHLTVAGRRRCFARRVAGRVRQLFEALIDPAQGRVAALIGVEHQLQEGADVGAHAASAGLRVLVAADQVGIEGDAI